MLKPTLEAYGLGPWLGADKGGQINVSNSVDATIAKNLTATIYGAAGESIVVGGREFELSGSADIVPNSAARYRMQTATGAALRNGNPSSCSLLARQQLLHQGLLRFQLFVSLDHDYNSAKKGGNRYATILLYMTDLEEGDGGE